MPEPDTAAVCGPCSVNDHMACLGNCGCGYCAEMRDDPTEPVPKDAIYGY